MLTDNAGFQRERDWLVVDDGHVVATCWSLDLAKVVAAWLRALPRSHVKILQRTKQESRALVEDP